MASLGEDLLGVVNKLQDLVFNTIGNDSLDLPQIVSLLSLEIPCIPLTISWIGSSRFSIIRKIISAGKHSRARFPTPRQWHSDKEAIDTATDQRPKRAG